ncbi:SgcJ/EcaC family oxidoreductase [Actinosynnema sp. NPDC002837]
MDSKASSLVAQAKQWATYYGDYTTGPEGAALTIVLRFRALWEDNDAEGITDLFVENGSLLLGDEQLKGHGEIHAYLTAAFNAGFSGTKLIDEVADVRLLSPDVAMVITTGGLAAKDATSVPEGNSSRTMWVVVKRDGDWWLASYQSSPLQG